MGLLQQDAMILDQVRGFMSNDFAISDLQGQPVGWIQTEGSGASRFFMGNRKFLVSDSDGTPVVRLDDVVSFGRERMHIQAPDGQALAELLRRFSFFRTKVSLMLGNGAELIMDGSVWERNFTIASPEQGELARVARQYRDIGQALLGRERYVLEIQRFVEPWLRATIIGAVIGLDLIRAKDRQN